MMRQVMRRLMMAFAAVVFGMVSLVHAAAPPVRVLIPVVDKRIELGSVFTKVCTALNLETPPQLADLVWSIKPRSLIGRGQLKAIDAMLGPAVSIRSQRERVVINIDVDAMTDRVESGKDAMQGWLEDVVDSVTALQPEGRRFGVTIHDGSHELTPRRYVDRVGAMPEHLVLLVHGLDDPGFIWNDLVPALQKEGHVVALLVYPNDGPIVKAADRLALELADLKRRGVTSVDLVAHSMGGLVARDTLTRDVYYGGDATGSKVYPTVKRLVMCGTPNAGSELARLRGVVELREQIVRMFGDGAGPLGGLTDGNGEAGADLLPGSPFLAELNGRPLPTNLEITIIAARMTPVAPEAVADAGREIRAFASNGKSPAWLRKWVGSASRGVEVVLGEAVGGLGDGCVTLKSARLEGVDDIETVKANHLTMLLNPLVKTTPPAIPIILDRLTIGQ